MGKYRVVFAGNTYELEVERVDAAVAVLEKPVSHAEDHGSKLNAESPKVQVMDAPAAKKEVGGSNVVTSPMPGTVVKIFARNGESVKKGQVVLILEAMKMENEITAPTDGVVAGLEVEESASVQGGAVLFEVLD